MAADYEVEVTIHSFDNPTGRCSGCRERGNPHPGCCDESFIRHISQACPMSTDTCDPSVDYCIKAFGSTSAECPDSNVVLSEFAVEETNSYSISQQSDFFGLENPLLIMARNQPHNV